MVVALYADAGVHPMVARMNVGDEASSRSATNLIGRRSSLTAPRSPSRPHSVHLDAERAANVLVRHAPDALKTKVLGEQVLHHVRRLRALVDGKALLAGVPVGHDRARLVGDAGVAAEPERRFDDCVCQRKSLIRVAGLVLALEREIVAELGVDHRRRRIERGLRIGDRRELLVFDVNKLASVFRLGAVRHDGADRLALPACALDRDRMLWRGFDALEMGEDTDSTG
jgi:hypothetical protein